MPDPSRLPLSGMRVLDLSYVFSVPYIGGLLTDFGAEVIKIEAPHRLDQSRSTFGPFVDNTPGDDPWNRTGSFQMLNRGKRSFVLDLGNPAGQDLFRDLVAKSDIVLENYTPRVMRKWRLDYPELRKINPSIIMLSNTGYGSTGPWAMFPSQGTTLEVTMGIASYSGYEGDDPWKVGQSYPDFLACWTGLLSIFAALRHRERTGDGQWIDVGMYQIGAALVPEPILQYQLDGADWERIGNRHRSKSPSNVYPAKGDDRWCAISVAGDEEWCRLLRMMDREDLLSDTRFTTAAERWKHRDAVDQLVAAWTCTLDGREIMAKLQTEGIACGPVLDSRDLLWDEQLRHRRFYELVDHPRPIGVIPVIGRPFKLRFTDLRVQRHAPPFGEGNRYVLTELLALDDSRIAELYEQGVVTDRPVNPPSAEPQDLKQMRRVGSVAEVDPDYRAKLAIYPDTADAP